MDVYLRDRLLNTTVLVSANYHGTGGGNGSSTLGMLSTYGRYVVFESDSSDLVPGDTNAARDIFIRDLVAGTSRLVSVAADGGFGNSASWDPVMTPDGTSVAFVSAATNLVAGDTNTIPGVFVRDLISQTTWRVSAGATLPAGVSFSGVMASPVITPDGRYVAFFSTARGLTAGVTSLSKGDVYVHDLWTGQTTWASTNAAALAQSLLGPTFSNSPSYHPVISQDGRFVTFKTGGTNGIDPVVILQFDSLTGATTVLNTNGVSTTSWSDDVYGPEATPDGRFVAFAQRELVISNSVFCSLHVWDTKLGVDTLVSPALVGGVPTNTFAHTPVLSPGGQVVAFLSDATNLVTNSVLSGFHVYLRDLQAGTTALVDVDTNGVASADAKRTVPSLSDDGSLVAFSSPDGSLVGLDNNKAYDVFVRDVVAGNTTLVSQRNASVTSLSADSVSGWGPFSLSSDGRLAAFASYADDLVPGETNGTEDVFVRDLSSGTNLLVSVGADGSAAAGGFSANPVISANGRFVVFISTATNLVAGHTNLYANLFRRDLVNGTTDLVSVGTNDVSSGDNDSVWPVISQDGRYVAFLSRARNLAPGLPVGGFNTFWRDMVSGVTLVLPTPPGSLVSTSPPSMSSDGRYVAYVRSPFQLWVWDAQAAVNIYSNLSTVTSAAISPDGRRVLYEIPGALRVDDLVGGTNLFSFGSALPIASSAQWSADGRFFTFVTTNATPSDTNKLKDVYLYDLLGGMLTLVSFNGTNLFSGNGPSDSPVLSADGRFLVYRSFATDIVPGQIDSPPNIFVFDRLIGSNKLLTAGQSGLNWISWTAHPAISSDGTRGGFQSWGAGLVPGDVNRVQDLFSVAMDNASTLDSDGDGIPDWWMMLHFGHPTGLAADNSLAQDDADGDGMTNLQEFLAGTDPNNPNSVLRLWISQNGAGSGALLNWPVVPGRSYQVEYKQNLDDPVWQRMPGTLNVLGGLASFVAPMDQPRRFYHVLVVN
jgi:Tol biopolymer transport system component